MEGLGEAGAWAYLNGCSAVIESMKPDLIGQDPFRMEHLWNCLYRGSYFRGSVIMSAIAAIDIALWDIKGKALGVPVYELLGGLCREKVRCYQAVFARTPDEIAQGCRTLQEAGWDAARLMILPPAGKESSSSKDHIFSRRVGQAVAKVRAARETVGEDFDLILEVHRSMDPMEAVAFAKAVEPYHPLFLEDPIPPDSPEAMAEVAHSTVIPLATGERFINIQEFETIFQRRAAQYVRPDVCALGGLTPAKKVAAMAEANYCKVVPHNPLGPVSTAACLQLDAAIPNFAIQEFPSFYHQGNEAQMLREPLEEEGGYLRIPNRPGIGVDLVEDVEERFPPLQRSAKAHLAYDGSVMDM